MTPRAHLGRLAGDRRGATAITTALLLVVTLGFVGFGIDFGMGYTARRTAQGAADSAAFSGSVAQWAGAGDAIAQAKAVAATYGLKDGAGGVTVTVNTPPGTGSHTTDPNAVEVVIAQPGAQFFSGLFGQAGRVIRARAVATVQPAKNGDGCVLALDRIDLQTIGLNGNINLNLDGCSIWDNSASSGALNINGSATLTATSVNVVGGVAQGGRSTINGPVNRGVAAAADPFKNTNVPSYSPGGCDPVSSVSASKTYTPTKGVPYVFCSGLAINGNGTVTFGPGTYVIDGGSLTINGGMKVRGTGVTFVLTNHTGSNIATVTINGGADVNLAAPLPSSGEPLPGIVFYQDRAGATTGQSTFNGGANQLFTGALYFPTQTVKFNGNNSTTSGGCTELLAYRITFNGDARFSNHCDGLGVPGIGGFTSILVE